MMIQYDQNWPSDCYQKHAGPEDWVPWQPVLRQQQADFSALEQALALQIQPQLKAYFSRYWSDNLDAKHPWGNIQLLFPWNPQDFVRLQQNLVGHVLMKRRLKQPETLFFALTEQDDLIVTLDNESGAVVLEQVGLSPEQPLAEDLTTFIRALQPLV